VPQNQRFLIFFGLIRLSIEEYTLLNILNTQKQTWSNMTLV